MARIGIHASPEQFPPSEPLRLVELAEVAGFDCVMSSDHFRPWGPAQRRSGFERFRLHPLDRNGAASSRLSGAGFCRSSGDRSSRRS